ncbi:MAG TPA: GntR family transcriptional regulator [Pseudothermotoga sp.]|nr:GntR family transcriptional regulator [Pseudothermotoga sp.]HOK82992.1 GntR family transcriptional regulator [Pseudothermotoga sp.]HPP69839.1 GntR family transcriptional regulator [Pseudothermotoga sp.]
MIPFSPDMIERESPMPLYYQVEKILHAWITKELKPGSVIPGEKDLCDAFQVSRSVVRQALSDLTNKGLIKRYRGIGTVVVQPKIDEHLVSTLTGFYADMISQGMKPKTKVLQKEIKRADEILAHYLSIKPGDQVIKIHRLRFIEEEPILLVTTFLPLNIFPQLLDEDLEGQSLYYLLESKYGIKLAWGERTIEAISADSQDAKFLGITKGDPLLFLRSITYTEQDIPVEYYEAKHRADRARFITRLFRTPIDNQKIASTFDHELRLTRYFAKKFQTFS